MASASASAPQTRKRKRPQHQALVHYREEQEVDSDTGQVRDVIVIEDTPPPTNGILPLPPIPRTRAQAAAAAAGVLSNPGSLAPAPKKRKRDPADDGLAGPSNPYVRRPPPQHNLPVQSWPSVSGAPTEESVASSQVSKAPPLCDDKEGHYIITPDDMIQNRYRTVRLLGQGTFGKVVECVDVKKNTRVAIKIIRAIPKYRDASKIEIRVLNKLKERDPLNRHKCIHLIEWFDHKNHVCIVSELLGMCIYDFLKENEFYPFPRSQIQSFARQLLGSVAFLHDLHLVHTDLKPENILLVHNSFRTISVPPPPNKRNSAHKSRRILTSTDIRLIDFGSATFEQEYHSTVVSTRHYRAPEIILGLGWSYPCDAFSLGCILIEFYTGVALFQTHDNLEHLAMMEMVMGKMPERFARSGARSKPEFFREGAKLDWPKPKASKQSKKDVKMTKSLEEIVIRDDPLDRNFLDLVRQLLHFDPAQRITVREALAHPYFTTPPPPDQGS